ncbi:SDR family NAD(P)-dependent oxidoreductase [Massilia sp. PAMC28688]|uniref:SDR family NAD(P)-dependent oxidoreductase n=1 Tax=Massilia sp. PAMC28688 TaxID=2861283 RepID=UPI001C624F0C|nr:SDR family NAD(P)-dependent oxidoreductase [Massilia sp. PAMC28688]QYF93466.1 SDR family NAD(P)-dependent oxidoreductase [Massilia sp. PAMC28688]
MGHANHEERLLEWAETYLTALVGETIDGMPASFDRHTPFAETGIDSFRVLKLIKRLEEDFGRLPKTLLFENINIADLAGYFASNHGERIAARLGAAAPLAQSAEAMPFSATQAAAPVKPVQPVAAAPAKPKAVKAAAPRTPAPAQVPAQAAAQAEVKPAAAPVLMLERDVHAHLELGPLFETIFDQYKNEAGASRGARSIAPNVFFGSARRGFFNYARCKNIIAAYAFTGPDEYFAELAEELLAHCNAHGLQLNIFSDRVLGAVGATRFSSTPFGALQRVVKLDQFSLEGGPMRRLRYQVSKFQKAGVARTVEYVLGQDAAVEQAIASVIDAWCAAKPMVNPLIRTVRDEILGRTLHPRHRLFLTYLDDVLQNVILISPLGPQYNGYLMDLEFYDADMPLGGLEFTAVQIIEQLVAEGRAMLSMGGTYGCRLETCADADPGIDAVLDELHRQGIFNDDGNLQFKNKFRTENQTIYLCRAAGAGEPGNIIDIIMMIADPDAMQTPDTEHHTKPAAAPAAAPAAPPAERSRACSQRLTQLEQAGFNPANLAPAQVQIDLKTDSWAQLSNPVIDGQMSHLRSQLQTAAPVDACLRSMFGFAHYVLTTSGRSAEEVFYKTKAGRGAILGNVLFPSGLFHQIDNGFDAIEMPCAAALDPHTPALYKGDLDWDGVAARVQADPASVAMVCVELSNNAAGGAPVAMAPLKALKALLAQHRIALVIDATRVLENAQYIIEHDSRYAGAAMMTVAREIVSLADVITCSLAKDFGVNTGGMIATNDPVLFKRLEQQAAASGAGLDAIGRKLVALALQDQRRIERQVLRRMESVRLMWTAFHERGIAVAQPAGTHCVLFDVKALPLFATLPHPVASFVAWFFLHTGIRVGAHSVGMQHGGALDGMVRMAIPVGMTAVQVEQVVRSVVAMFECVQDIPELLHAGGAAAALGNVHARFELAAMRQCAQAPATLAAPVPVVPPEPDKEVQAPARAEAPAAAETVSHTVPVAPPAVRDIAIVGMAGRYPHAANLDQLWRNLAAGADAVEDIPAERLAMRGLFGKAERYRGGFIADIDRFDSLFFNISPRDAELIDPQERHFLEVAWEAMEDAGYSPETLVREDAPRNIGVFVGAVWAMYQMVGLEQRHAGNPTSPNSFLWSIANHVSYSLNLTGPSMTVDTACSSSLTALYLACESIYKGECAAAIVGGVNLDLHQGKLDINLFGGALSDDGVCRTFGKGANGYVAGEGVGAIMVKPLADAERDGDAIYGVIKGVAVNHGGRSSGYAVPSPTSQAEVIMAALERSGVDARTVGYIEAHGTGTELGDPIEIRGLSKAFEKYGVDTQSCAVGSVKTNIGHLEAAAGIVGISKVLLQMRHGQLAPSLHSQELNEHIDFASSPFYVVQKLEPWLPKQVAGSPAVLRAGVSSFGAGGSNTHVILESYPAPVARVDERAVERVFPLSARTEAQLRDVALRLKDWLEQGGASLPALDSVARTLQAGRRHFEFRSAVLASTREELIERLGQFIAGSRSEQLLVGSAANAATINKLLTRREQDAFSTMLTTGGDLRRLAQLWVDGMFTDWRSTAAYEPGMRAHLPTYPFADRRHWAGRGVKLAPALAGPQAALHPMLDANESTFERQVFKKQFHNRDFFIYDHLVSQIPTLPGVAYLELARKAGEMAAGRPVRRIKNILWLSPIVVHGADAQEVMIELKPKGDVVHFEVYSLGEGDKRMLHAQGQLLYTGSPDAAQADQIDLAAIQARCDKVIDGRDAYPQFQSLGLGLGPSFQVLREIHKNSGETLGRLRLSAERQPDLQQLLLHPALVDGSLQVGAASKLDDATAQMAVPYSIGEVEILHPLQAECWSYVQVANDAKHAGSRVSRANVLIVDEQGKVLVRLRDTVGVPLTEVHKDAAAEQAAPALRYSWQWNRSPLDTPAQSPDGIMLVLGAQAPLLEQLRAASGAPERVIDVQAGPQFAQCGNGSYEVDGADAAAFTRLLDAVEGHGQRVAHILFAPAATVQETGPEQSLDQALEHGPYRALALCQALAGRKLQDKVRLTYLFATSGEASPAHEAMNGFAGALRLEHPKVLFKCVELRDADAAATAAIALAESTPAADTTHAVRYDGAQRSVRRLQALAPAAAEQTVLREGGVYVITGGAGGLGLLFAEYLARQYKARLVLTGRSALGTAQQARLDAMEKLGAQVCHVRADVADREQLAAALAEGRERFGAIHGVIHSAGVVRDSYIRNKTRAEMQAVLAPKVMGSEHLDELTRGDALDFFAMFSSMSAIGGNIGQCDYCYANHYMDTLAIRREAQRAAGERQGKTLSINWALWQDGGMKLDEQSERLFRKATGIRPLASAMGIAAFVDGLAAAEPQMVVVDGERDMLETAWGLRKPAAPAVPAAAAAAPAGAAGSDAIAAMLRRELTQIAMDFLKLEAEDIQGDKILLDLGFDSVGLATFANLVNEKFALDITPILFFDYPSIDEIARNLASERADDLRSFVQGGAAPAAATAAAPVASATAEAPAAPMFAAKNWQPDAAPASSGPAAPVYSEQRFAHQPIAIVGMSAVMPESENTEAFWNNLRQGKNMVSLIPGDRWSWEEHFGDPLKEQGKTNSKWGGFMSDVDKFDPLFFGISPREAQMMDPQQRIFLQSVWEAIEDAGHKVSDLAGTKTGLFVGVATNDYVNLVNRLNVPINAYTASGNSHSVLANRVSFLLNLRGPSAPIDTACSSSLIALHRAIESIHTGSSDMAIVGGVQIMLTPAAHVSFSMAGMLSDDGKCKTFDKRANGYVRGEGTGAILIKPLDKAEADGDHIYAVVRATAENHGGRVTTLTAPNATAQTALLVEAYTKAAMDPTTVGYIECHGTGTSLGDPIEVQALGRAFAELYKKNGKDAATEPHCALSSVKTNIGHLETAAGIAGIVKALLAIKHKQIPANVHFEELNPYISLKGTPFYIPQQTRDWEAPRDSAGNPLPRRAGVSSFGFGGANAHVVLEEYVTPAASAAQALQPRVFVVSARNMDRLQAYAARLLAFVDSGAADLERLAYTLQVGRDVFAVRLAFVASDLPTLRTKLAAAAAGKAEAGVFIHHVRPAKGGEAASGADDAARDLAARGDLEALAELWAGGADVDWTLLYPNGLPRRTPIPTYPFARERHWLPLPEAGAAPVAVEAGAVASMLHPLVQVNTSNLQEQKFISRFSGREFFLSDHVVQSQRVLPGVAYMEMARAAGELAAGQPVRSIRSLVWLSPLIVGEEGGQAEIALVPKGAELEFSVRSTVDGRTVTHCTGQLAFGAGTAEQVDLAALRARCPEQVMDRAALYRYFENNGLKLGKTFQIVERIWSNAEESLAQLVLPEQGPAAGAFMLNPALMDGALHTAIGLMKKGDIEPPLSLPFAVAEVEIFGNMRDVCYSHATWSAQDRQADPSHWKVNFLFLDQDGKVLVRITQFASRPLQRGQAVVAGNGQQAELHRLLPVWQSMAADKGERSALPPATRLLVAGASDVQLMWLRASFPQSQALDLGAAPEALAAQLRDAAFDQLVWMAPDAGGDMPHDLIAAQEQGVIAVFNLTKALLGAGFAARDLQWTMITARTRTVHPDDDTAPANASVFGYFGCLAREYPHWQLRLLDVDTLDALDAAACLEQLAGSNGKALAWRRGEWFVQELALAENLPVATPAYRQGGTYVVIGGAGGIGEAWSRHMIETYQANIVWIGRRACDAQIQARIDALAAIGNAPLYVSADATDAQALARARDTILQRYSAIHGVVHSALVLRDQSVALMDVQSLRASLAAKVDTSVHADAVFGAMDLDFMLYFSSILTFNSSPGQSNYAAGCAFQDAFGRYLSRQRPYPVKTMHWGYWGNVGVVADKSYLETMAQMGIGSIEPDEAMQELAMLVASPLEQMALLKTVGTRALATVATLDRVRWQTPRAAPVAEIAVAPADPALLAQLEGELPSAEQVTLVDEILAATLRDGGHLAGGAPALSRHHALWREGSVRYLQKGGWLDAAAAPVRPIGQLDALWQQWSALRTGWISARPHHEAQTVLIESCLRALPEILAGQRLATEVLFPRASMHLVEGVYKGNPLADHFNSVLGSTLAACIEQGLRQDPARKFRILEIGAGTGGTTATLLPVLARFGDALAEYCYTDVSKAFLMHAAKHHQPHCAAMTTAIFDVCKPLAGQAITPGVYDIVVAANVLHATPSMRATLRNAKAALTHHGVLLLNEISTWSMFSHLTFGLLEGWWAVQDNALRLPDSPGLAPATWARLLGEEGFDSVSFPALHAHAFGQQIIAAGSDGVVRQGRPLQASAGKAAPKPAQEAPRAAVQAAPPEHAQAQAITPPQAPQRAAPREVKPHMGRDHIRTLVAQKLSEALQLDLSRIGRDEPFAEYGVDSIVGVNLVRTISESLHISLETTSLFEYSTVNDLGDYIHATWGEQLNQADTPAVAAAPVASVLPVSPVPPVAPVLAAPPALASRFGAAPVADSAAPVAAARGIENEPIAIIGMSGRFAQSDTLDQFWCNLRDGAELIQEVTRWKPEDSIVGPAAEGTYCRHGSFIDSIDRFDAGFFRIPALEAAHMDPQQRLFLEEAWKALEDAGYGSKSGREKRCGVYVGCGSSKYDALIGSDTPAHAFWGNAESVIPARIAYYLDLQGPAIAVNTACSSSLVTIHLACQSLRSGETEMALAGGVFLEPTAGFHQVANRAGMLSPTGRLAAFEARANGFVPGEGVGAVVLKRLSDALRDGDHIHGVIRASGVNQDGSSNGIIAPNAAAQERLECEVYERFGIDPESIQFVEAHGTGTLMGDSIEFGALTRAFRKFTPKTQFCAIGTVKANIGHAATAAGVAGVLKLLVSLKHRQLPPSKHFDTPSPAIDMAGSPFYVNRDLQAWEPGPGSVRRAAISSFGFSGTNAHLIIEEAPAAPRAAAAAAPGYLVVLSARAPEQVQEQVRQLHAYLQCAPDVAMQDLSYTLLVGRTHHPVRLACVAANAAQLAQMLATWLAQGAAEGVFVTAPGEEAARERHALKKYGAFCISQFATAHAEEALDYLATLADLFAQGYALDYAALIAPGTACRIALPTYPFARERHWFEARQQRAALLHPLLHENTSTLGKVSFRSSFDGSEFFLAGQEGASTWLLPAGVQLDMVQAAVARAMGGTAPDALELQQVQWRAPAVLAGGAAVAVELVALADGALGFTVADADAPDLVYCQGRALHARSIQAAAAHDIARLQNQMHGGLADGDSVYMALAARGLPKKEQERAVISVLRGEGELLAHLRIPAVFAADAHQYGLHPALSEAVFGVALGLLPGAAAQGLQAPAALDGLRHEKPCSSEMFAWIRHAGGARLDLDLIDADGTVCAAMRGLTLAPASPAQAGAPAAAAPTVHRGSAPASPEEKIEHFLRAAASQELRVAAAAVDPELSFFELGFTSLGVASLIRQVNGALAADLPPSMVFEYPTIRILAARLAQTHGAEIAGMEAVAVPAPLAAPAAAHVNGADSAIFEQLALNANDGDLAGYEKLSF